jgi:hypothetical protein
MCAACKSVAARVGLESCRARTNAYVTEYKRVLESVTEFCGQLGVGVMQGTHESLRKCYAIVVRCNPSVMCGG